MSLAQLFFDGPTTDTSSNDEIQSRMNRAKDSLSCGYTLDRSAACRKPIQNYLEADARLAAQRFVVEGHDVYDLSKLGMDVFDTGFSPKLPAEKVWIEAPITFQNDKYARRGKVGGLFWQEGGWTCADYFTDIFDVGIPVPWVSGRVWHHGYRDNTVRLEWYLFEHSGLDAAADGDNLFCTLSNSIALLIAALNAPKVVQKEEVQWSQAIQKARMKRGRHPLLSFVKVKLVLPKSSQPSAPTSRQAGSDGVRFHSVLGHIRKLDKASGPELTWVRPHFRGDARLGIIVKQRAIKPGGTGDAP